jgi:tRNA (guanosine-2'-O-)-methyltransferase
MQESEERVLAHLAQFISENKKNLTEKVLAKRTKQLTVILEDIYQSQNASAVIRTAECMGIQDVHIVENSVAYYFNIRVLRGAHKWIDIHRYQDKEVNNTATCFDHLRKNGYRILVADPSPTGLSIHDIDITEQKTALLFGNELNGVSRYALDHADQRVTIPMVGFTESLNISVSAAICVNALITKLHASGENYYLTEAEKNALRIQWYRNMVKKSDLIEREFLRSIE